MGVPGQLCKAVLHNCRIRPRRGERPHVLQIPGRVAAGSREPFPQIRGQPIDDPGPPSLLVLPGQDVCPNRPIRQQQLPVPGRDRPLLPRRDPAGHNGQQIPVPGRQHRRGRWSRKLCPTTGPPPGQPSLAHRLPPPLPTACRKEPTAPALRSTAVSTRRSPAHGVDRHPTENPPVTIAAVRTVRTDVSR